MLIGICGKAGSGKDTVAEMLVRYLPNTERHGFADPLKEMALAIDPLIEGQNRLSHFVNSSGGWAGAKKHPEVRRFLQKLGTDGVRGTFGPDAWVNLLCDKYYDDFRLTAINYVIPDVRYDNEADTCDYVVEVVRPGLESLAGTNATHVSEQGVTRKHYMLVNDGTVEELEHRVKVMLKLEAVFSYARTDL